MLGTVTWADKVRKDFHLHCKKFEWSKFCDFDFNELWANGSQQLLIATAISRILRANKIKEMTNVDTG